MLRNLHEKVLNKDVRKYTNDYNYRNSAPELQASGARRIAQSSEAADRNRNQPFTSSLLGISTIL